MIEVQDFNEKSIPKGSLVFIQHKEKPCKTGWWLKTTNYNKEENSNSECIYVLVKRITDFEIEDYSSRMEHCHFVMKSSSLDYGVNKLNKYNILAVITGVESIILQKDDYSLNSKIFIRKAFDNSKNVKVTYDFITLLKYLNNDNNNEEMLELSRHINK